MPPSIRFQGGDSKRIFREAVGSKLPVSIRNRHDKMGFPVPLNQWARGPLKSFLREILLGSRARQRGFYHTDAIEKLISSEKGFGRELWGVLCLELWLRAYMDGDFLQQELRIA